jgi:hypothetical protein
LWKGRQPAVAPTAANYCIAPADLKSTRVDAECRAAGATAPAGAAATVAAACESLARRRLSKRPTDAARHRTNSRRRRVGALLASAVTTGTPVRGAAALLAKGQ